MTASRGRWLVRGWAVIALSASVAACGGQTHAPTVRQPSTASQGVLRHVHSPGVVADDMHLHAGQCHTREAADGDPLPDPGCTPGAIDPAVTQATIHTTICVSGYTATVRPPSSNTGKWKRISEADYGYPAAFVGELDHLVPLELGGANSTSNLWPEPGAIPNGKDKVENRLHDAVCAGRITLYQAQQEITHDWTLAQW